jgi:lipoprotein-anchoring transpeptidase ErfK/SrfK
MIAAAATLAGAAAAGAIVLSSASGASAPAAPNVQRAHAAPRPIAGRPTSKEAWTARVLYPVVARRGPKKTARRHSKVSPFAPYDQGPQQLLVLRAESSARHGVWYYVQLPRRPNTAAAWLPAAAVKVARTRYRVKVDLSDRRAYLIRNGATVRNWRVVVGMPAYPTPVGRFSVSEVVRQSRAGGFFGPYIITLSAHSDRLNDFAGGDGRVALHGTSLPGLLGSASSHGCVRFENAAISEIAKRVPPGAPVDVQE